MKSPLLCAFAAFVPFPWPRVPLAPLGPLGPHWPPWPPLAPLANGQASWKSLSRSHLVLCVIFARHCIHFQYIYIYMYIYIYIYIFIYIYNMYTYVYTYTYMRVYMHTCIYIYIYIYVCVCVFAVHYWKKQLNIIHFTGIFSPLSGDVPASFPGRAAAERHSWCELAEGGAEVEGGNRSDAQRGETPFVILSYFVGHQMKKPLDPGGLLRYPLVICYIAIENGNL